MIVLPLVMFLLQTSPATLPADLSSPKNALRSLHSAADSADPARVRAVLCSVNPTDAAMLDAYAGFISSSSRLAHITKVKFPNSTDPIARGLFSDTSLTAIEQASVTETGAAASIRLAGSERPIQLRKEPDGMWRIDIATFGEISADEPTEQARLLNEMAKAMRLTADDVEIGKYPTETEAAAGLQQRLHDVLARSLKHHAGTQPATTQATTRSAG